MWIPTGSRESAPNGISIGQPFVQGSQSRDQQTDRQTTLRHDVCSNSPHLALRVATLAKKWKTIPLNLAHRLLYDFISWLQVQTFIVKLIKSNVEVYSYSFTNLKLRRYWSTAAAAGAGCPAAAAPQHGAQQQMHMGACDVDSWRRKLNTDLLLPFGHQEPI